MLNTVRFIASHPLCSERRGSAILRYLRWQVGVRVLKMPVVVPFVGNTELVVERSMTGATGNVYCGLHEFADMAFCLHFLRDSDVFLDVGANVGSYTILASGVVGARSISIEPVPQTYRNLVRNLRHNGIEQRVDAYACVAGSAPGELRFSLDQDTTNGVVGENYRGTSALIPVRTLDNMLKGAAAALWKVDVEGFEEEVIAGASEALRNPSLQALLLELDSPSLRSSMRDAGFKLASYDPFSRKIVVLAKHDEGAGGSGSNNLWIRDQHFVQARCLTGPKHTVLGVAF